MEKLIEIVGNGGGDRHKSIKMIQFIMRSYLVEKVEEYSNQQLRSKQCFQEAASFPILDVLL